MLFSGVRLEACEVVEEAQCLGVECSGGCGDDRHEPVVLSLKPLVVLGHLGAVGPVECVLVAGVLRASLADRMHDCEVERQAGGALRVGWPTSSKDLETFTNLSILSGAPAHPHPRSKIKGPRSEHQDSR